MQKRRKLQQQLLIAGCATMVIASSGCRSAMPKWNMLSWRSTPSAETLAGNGPSITYPSPPSEAATPDAIASVAGGTADPSQPITKVASNTSPIVPMTSQAAAQANGFNIASSNSVPSTTPTGTVPGYAAQTASSPSASSLSNSSVPTIPVGYQFGKNEAGSTGTSATGGSYVMPSSYPAPGAPSMPSESSRLPTGASAPTAPSTASSFAMPSKPTMTPPSTNGGFAMPSDVTAPVNAQPFTPKTASSSNGPSSTGTVPTAGLSLPGNPGASTPAIAASTGSTPASFSTASASLTPRSSENTLDTSSSGYAPGSTSGANGYPATSGYPSTGTDGSFYR